jgi:NitT/TauT family transport system permease protein
VPYTALFPLFLLFFGIGDIVKFAVCAWSAWLIVLVNTMYGVQHCSPGRRRVAQTFKATNLQVLWKIVVPEAAPSIAAGLRTGLSVAIQAAVVVEMFMGTTSVGLGQLIYNAAMLSRAPEMYAGIITAGIMGYAVNFCFVYAEKRVLHWTSA